jgi:hypothetical protein
VLFVDELAADALVVELDGESDGSGGLAVVPRWPPAASFTSRTGDRMRGAARHADEAAGPVPAAAGRDASAAKLGRR